MADLEIDSNLSGSVGTSVSGTFGAVGPVTLSGIPDTYTIKVPEIDKIESNVKLEPVQLNLGPIQTSVSIKEIPSTRVHLPANYCVGFSLFGTELAAIRLCGEGMVVIEPYKPNPCEICDVPPGKPAVTAGRPGRGKERA